MQESIGPTIDVRPSDDVVPLLEEHHRAVRRRHAAGIGKSSNATFQRSNELLQALPRRIAGSGIVKFRGLPGPGKNIGGGNMNWRHHGPGLRISVAAYMDGSSSER